MKTYIFFATVIAGSPGGSMIYIRNKKKYLEDLGWNVTVFSANTGTIYIPDLKQYESNYIRGLNLNPYMISCAKRKSIVNDILNKIPQGGEEYVIESDGLCSHMAEYISSIIRAKHIIVYLHENAPQLVRRIRLYKYKFKRNEFACISKPVFQHLFSNYIPVDYDKSPALPCVSTNSVEDYSCDLINQIQVSDQNIGYIGRLEKPGFYKIKDVIIKYAQDNPNKKISFVCFGDHSSSSERSNLIDQFAQIENVNFQITGYIFPLPIKALKLLDLVVAVAGGPTAAAMAGVPAIRISNVTNEPEGFIKSVYPWSIVSWNCSLDEYLNLFFKEKKREKLEPYDSSKTWIEVCDYMTMHMDFMEKSSLSKEYATFIDYLPSLTAWVKNRFNRTNL